jgi:hypothetical protein
MSLDTRLWMYRKGEARLFDHPDQVPEDEEWRRFPEAGDEAADLAQTPGKSRSVSQQNRQLSREEKLNGMSRQRLMQVAADYGVRFEIGWTKAKLKQAIIEVLHDNHA